jgi:prepilin-type N-terminal cleavage/methylation domain-containing protein
MISQIKQKGFTIVELLIVIVVIAILAALSYVGYTSITARANSSTAAAAAKAVKDTAQTFNGANGAYPVSRAEFLSGGTDAVAKMPSDIVFAANAAAITGLSTSAPKTVLVERSPATGTITGFRITHRDFAGGTNVETVVGTLTPSTPTFATL